VYGLWVDPNSNSCVQPGACAVEFFRSSSSFKLCLPACARQIQAHLHCYIAHAMADDPVGALVVEDRELTDVGNQAGAGSGSEDESRKLSHADREEEILWSELGHGQDQGRIVLSFLQFPALARLMATRANSGWPLLHSALQGRLQEAYAMHFPGLQASVQTPRGGVRPLGLHSAMYACLPGNRLGWLWVQLWALQGPVQCPKKIAPGGATHLKGSTLIPWFDFLHYWYPVNTCIYQDDNTLIPWRGHNRAAMREKLDEFVWWLDLLLHDRDDYEDSEVPLHANIASCTHCRGLWSGVLANPDIVGDDEDVFIRFQLNQHIREPGTGNWRPLDDPVVKAHHLFECRLICISRNTSMIVCHADTRRAFRSLGQRFFGSENPGGRALKLKMYALSDEDDDGCVFNVLDLRHVSGTEHLSPSELLRFYRGR
jgi:hypothetical protein